MHQPPLPLQDSWTFSFDEGAARGAKQTDYEGSLRSLGSFDTVQGFWRYWNALSDKPLPEGSNLRLFKHDITPSWEHPANTKGGRWVFVVPKESTKRIWTALILALIGDQFSFSEDVCGAVLSTRFSTDTINLWNRDATSQSEIERCTTELSERLQIVGDAAVITEYKAHQQSLENNRSFAKIASSSGRIKRRYSVNTLRTHSGTASISPRASPRLSTSEISSDDATIATPSPPRSPRAMPSPISRAASTPAVLTLAAPPAAAAAHQRRSSPQPIHSPTLSPSTSSSPGSAGTPPAPHAPAPASGTPPKQRQLSLSSEDKRHKRDRSRGDKSKSVAAAAEPNKPAPVPPAPAEATEEAKSERKPAADSPAAKRAAPVPPVIAVSAPSDATSAVRITVAGSELKSRSGKSLSPVLLCTYLVFVFSVLVGVALVVLRPTAADALMRSLW